MRARCVEALKKVSRGLRVGHDNGLA